MKGIGSRTGFILVAAFLISCAGTADSPGSDGSITDKDEVIVVPVQKAGTEVVWRAGTEISKYVDGTVDKKITRTYNPLGNLLISTEEDGKGNLVYTRVYTWKNGQMDGVEVADHNGPVSVTRYKRDGSGNIVQETSTTPSGAVVSVLTFRYENGLLIESVAKDGSDKINLVTVYHYQDGNLVLLDYITGAGVVEAQFQRVVKDGKVMGERTLLPDGVVESERVFEYKGDLVVREAHYSSGTAARSAIFEYDANGNRTRETWTNQPGKQYEFIEREWVRFEISE